MVSSISPKILKEKGKKEIVFSSSSKTFGEKHVS